MVRDGSLSAGHARALLTHADPLKGARLIVEKGMSVRQAEQYVSDLGRTFKGGLLNRPPPQKAHTDDTDALAERLSESLGLKVKITFNGKSGAVTLNYTNLDQLDSILKLLEG
jgi:ParB family chromosome partitioning protein